MDKRLEYFINDRYKVLRVMVENETIIMGKKIVPLSQDNISELTGFSKAKVNSIVSDFIKEKYILSSSSARYQLSKSAFEIYNMLEKNN